MSNIGDFLKKQREKNGLSLKDVQKKTGISNSILSRIENDKKQSGASPIVLRSLSKLYGCSLIELFIMADYLDDEALSSYEQVFRNSDLLTDDERKNIQEQIDLFTKGRKRQ